MEVETSIYENIDKWYAGNKNTLQLKKPVTLVVLDIYKIYDNVNLDIIDPYIPDEFSEEWINEKRNLQTNMNAKGETTKPTKGIPQGLELAPVIINFLTTIILKDPLFKNEIEPYWKVTIYEGNWTIWTTESRKNTDYRLIKLKEILNKYGLTFLENEIKIHEFKYLSNLEPTNVKYEENKFTTSLGEQFRQSGNTPTLDPSNRTPKFNKYNSIFSNVRFTRHKYDTPKHKHYNELSNVWSHKSAYWYWYENKLYKRYKQMTIKRTKDYEYYAGNYNHRFKHYNIKIQYYLNRWKSLKKWVIIHKSNPRKKKMQYKNGETKLGSQRNSN